MRFNHLGAPFLMVVFFWVAVSASCTGVPEKMVRIPAGVFQMGSEEGGPDEKPKHQVYLDSYFIDKFEVTNAEFAQYVDSVGGGSGYRAPNSKDWKYYFTPGKEDHPVLYIRWNDAHAYCQWKAKRLPTEAEWEKAARGGLVGSRFPWGDAVAPEANFSSEGTRPVGSYPPNGYGVYDMAGNVWEYCQDWYDPEYYQYSPEINPQGPSLEAVSSRWTWVVIRGGSWESPAEELSVFYRKYTSLSGAAAGRPHSLGPSISIGFRCARDE